MDYTTFVKNSEFESLSWYNSGREGIFPGSSAVERDPVKIKVAGSNPARGAEAILGTTYEPYYNFLLLQHICHLL